MANSDNNPPTTHISFHVVIMPHATDMPCVVTLTNYVSDQTFDGVDIPQALRQLELLGADVVGVNCARGPDTMLPVLRKIKSVCKVRIVM